jgi:hypothetical protein
MSAPQISSRLALASQRLDRKTEVMNDPRFALDRRHLLHLSLAALPSLLTATRVLAASPTGAADPTGATVGATDPTGATAGATDPITAKPGPHDFDYFLGSWKVAHRRLGKRLVGSTDWEEFEGSTHCQSILGGLANMNDSVAHRASGLTRGMGLRAFDETSGNWADWYLDGRSPTHIDPPGIGRFAGGVGTFYSDETYERTPVRVRGIFTPVRAGFAQWEQAYSADGGKSWETNYVMRYTRTA